MIDYDRLHRYVTEQRREIHTACRTTPHTTAKTCSPTDTSLTIFKPSHCRTSGSSFPFGTPLTPSLLLPKQSSPVANDGDLAKYAKTPLSLLWRHTFLLWRHSHDRRTFAHNLTSTRARRKPDTPKRRQDCHLSECCAQNAAMRLVTEQAQSKERASRYSVKSAKTHPQRRIH